MAQVQRRQGAKAYFDTVLVVRFDSFPMTDVLAD